MPQIPFKIRERTIPGALGRAEMPSGDPVGKVITGMGEQVEDTATLAMRLQDAQTRLRRANETEEAGINIKKNAQLILDAHRSDPNSTAETVKKNYDAAVNNVTSKIGDPMVAQTISRFAEEHSISLFSNAGLLDLSRAIDKSQAATMVSWKEGLKNIADLPSMEAEIARMGMELDIKEDLLVYPADEVQKLKIKHSEDVAIAYYDNLISVNPAQAKKELNDKSNKATQYLDRTTLQALENDAKNALNNTQEDAAYAHLYPTFSVGKYEDAIKELRNPNSKVPAIKSLTADQRNSLESMIRGQEAYNVQEQNRINTEGKKKDLDLIGETYLDSKKGGVKEAIRLTQNSLFLEGMDKKKIIEDLQSPAPEGKSNPSSYLEGAEMMYDRSIPLINKKTWLLKNRSGLSITDFKHLANVSMSQERTNDKTAIAAGIKLIKDKLIPAGTKSDTTKRRGADAVQTYIDGVEEYKDRLDTPDKIRDYHLQILQMPKFNNVNVLNDRMQDLRNLNNKVNPSGLQIIETRKTADGRILEKLSDGTIREKK